MENSENKNSQASTFSQTNPFDDEFIEIEDTFNDADVDGDLGELPGGYGASRVVLMPRDPQWAYCYWDIPNEAKEELRRQGGQQLALRIYDTTDINLNAQAPHSVQEYLCDEMAREWYLPIPVSDRDYIADIGYRCADGRWLILARSASVRIPPVYPSDWIEDNFVTIDWERELNDQNKSPYPAFFSKRTSTASAFARIQDHQQGESFVLERTYKLQAGVRNCGGSNLSSVSDKSSTQKESIQLEIVVYTKDMDIQPSWIQSYHLNQSENDSFIEFQIKPTAIGLRQIHVEFIYKRHWLTKIQFEVEVVETEGNS